MVHINSAPSYRYSCRILQVLGGCQADQSGDDIFLWRYVTSVALSRPELLPSFGVIGLTGKARLARLCKDAWSFVRAFSCEIEACESDQIRAMSQYCDIRSLMDCTAKYREQIHTRRPTLEFLIVEQSHNPAGLQSHSKAHCQLVCTDFHHCNSLEIAITQNCSMSQLQFCTTSYTCLSQANLLLVLNRDGLSARALSRKWTHWSCKAGDFGSGMNLQQR